MISQKSHAGLPSNRDLFAFRDYIENVDVEVGECATEGVEDGLESVSTGRRVVASGKAVTDAVGMKHPVDGRFISLVPDLIKPLPGDCLVGFKHGGKDSPDS